MSTARSLLRLPRVTEGAISRSRSRVVAQRRWLRSRALGERPKKKDESKNGIYNQKEMDKYQEYLRLLREQNDGRTVRQQGEPQASQQQQQAAAPDQTSPGRNMQLAATLAQSDSSDLVTAVRIPDDPSGVLPPDHPALAILGNSSLVIQRQIEMMNIIMGFEQANRYIIMDGQGQTIGYIAERDHGFGSAMARQFAKTHRSFTTYIFDKDEREVLRIHRPFAWINSRIRIYDPIPEGGYCEMATSTDLQNVSAKSAVDSAHQAQVSPLKLEEMRIIGEAQQQWSPLRRKYNLFSYRPLEPARDDNTPRTESGDRPTSDVQALAVSESSQTETAIEAGMSQFAHVNEPFLSWDFTLRDESQNTIGSVNRNFGGFAREIFTDTGVYALRMDSAAQSSSLETASGQEVARDEREATAMTLDQRAVMLATAVSIDFDYFSRHSGMGSGGFMPFFWPMGGAAGAGEAGAAGAGAAGEAGAIEGASGAVGAAGRAVGSAGAGEGAIAGAGTMAGYEAMQRGAYGPRGGDDASPQANEPFSADGQYSQQGGSPGQQGGSDVWGEGDDPWGRGGPGDGPPPSAGAEGGGDGGEGGGGWMDAISDFFG